VFLAARKNRLINGLSILPSRNINNNISGNVSWEWDERLADGAISLT
jgi:hypothetical protein